MRGWRDADRDAARRGSFSGSHQARSAAATKLFQSSALYTHEQLVKLGVEAGLHVWEGLSHGLFYNADVPESKDAFNVMIKFFDRHLGAAVNSQRASVTVAVGTR